ncbi:Zn-dependent peptidase ImmA (M78 family) [Clostridium beijerinckii]|uniref:ImmA/IrrE family metallo-endopeptidase n=1 Tax=Clostridium beijerinckii TaxID=1520 RepID=UPI0014947929|nr:ImmA/IrrE family metallo-endopeptidase [Clostridium beijerinckii]NOW85585.1 Zn-dependent peptidase ImmA (M78 family) [Clostridium beijerinckii]
MKNIIDNKVNQLKMKYHTKNPIELCEILRIKILYENLGKNINGFYQAAPRNKIIHININLDEYSRYFTCSHELGHALFHSKLNILFLEKNTYIVKNKYENEADYFSADLYLSDVNIYSDRFSGMTIEQIAAQLHVPIELLKLKLK